MHLLIILLQQLLGMLPSSKQVLQPEVVRKQKASPNSGEPDACGRIVPTLFGWMTPFNPLPIDARPAWTAGVRLTAGVRAACEMPKVDRIRGRSASRAPSRASRHRPWWARTWWFRMS